MSRPQIIDTDSILDTALRVFGQLGYRRTSMQAIADECGISRPTLYLRFGSKDEIFLAMGRRSLSRVHSAAAQAAESGSSVTDRLVGALSAKLDFLHENFEADARSGLIGGGGKAAADLSHEFARLHRKLITGILAENATPDAAGMAKLLISSVLGIVVNAETPAIARQQIRRLSGLVVPQTDTRPEETE